MKNSVYHGDCLELMKNIEDKSIDMVLCDLPYGTTACKWDSVLPFDILWYQYERIIKNNGAIVLFAAQPFTSALVMSNLNIFKYTWVWRKPRGTGHLNAKKQPMRDTEDVCVFYKNQCTYNAQVSKGEPYSPKSSKTDRVSEAGETTYGKFIDGNSVRQHNYGFRWPKTVIEFGVVERNNIHPTQKPVLLFEYLIKTYTNEGETVLDNCAGSGTTAIACMNTKRNYVLMEKEEKYYDIIQERIANYKPLPKVIQMNGASQPEIHKEKMPTQQKQQMLLNL